MSENQPPELAIDVKETVEGFNVDKARKETLHLVVIRPGAMMIGERYRSTKAQ